MDRSLLSQKNVIAASREFVCIRLATYESAEEAKYLAQVFRGRMGTLENTVFAILSPDARQYLARPGRSPEWDFATPDAMAAEMKRLAAQYPANAPQTALPTMADFRLALNTAACDNMPLVVAVADNNAARTEADKRLAQVAWMPSLLGKFAYAPASDRKTLAKAGITASEGVALIEPDTYGQTGAILAHWELATPASTLAQKLLAAQKLHTSAGKIPRDHIGQGRRRGVNWQSAIPSTDPHG